MRRRRKAKKGDSIGILQTLIRNRRRNTQPPRPRPLDTPNSCKDVVVPARDRAVVPTGLAIAAPSGTYARIAPRSGLAVKKFLDTGAGVVDEDYRGEVGVVLFNHSGEDFHGEEFVLFWQLWILSLSLSLSSSLSLCLAAFSDSQATHPNRKKHKKHRKINRKNLQSRPATASRS